MGPEGSLPHSQVPTTCPYPESDQSIPYLPFPKTVDTADCIHIQGVPLATEPGISLIILKPMKILQQNLNRSTFVVWEIKRNVSVVCVCFFAISSLVLELLKKCRVR